MSKQSKKCPRREISETNGVSVHTTRPLFGQGDEGKNKQKHNTRKTLQY